MVKRNKIINKRNIVSLFILSSLFLVISTSIVSYTIGKLSGVSGSGRIIDTIIIEEPQNTDKLPVYLTGKVSYSNGISYQGKVSLFSKMQETTTDKNGVFLFKNIVYGKHSFLVIDDNGNKITEMSLTINQSTTTDKIVINKNKTGYEVNVGINIALIEVNLKLDKDKKEIVLNEDNITIVNYSGKIINPNKTTELKTNIIKTFNGNKVMPEGIIVLPNKGVILSNGTFITNTGQITYSEDETSLPNGYLVSTDVTITLPNKTVIKPDGTIIRPEAEDTKPVSGDDNKKPEDHEDSEEPIEPEEPDPLTWDAPIVKQGNMRWDQLTTLDLFATNNSSLDENIYPGVSGEYVFSIENINPYNVLFSINMKEQDHEAGNINLSYRLKYYDDKLNKYVYVIGNDNNYLKPNELSTTDKVALLSNSDITYILEWTWGNENNKEQDLRDGKLGTSDQREHFINMTIYIENA